VGEAFNLRFARSRLSLIALFDLHPLDVRTGRLVDVPTLLASAHDLAPQLFPSRPTGFSGDDAAVYASVGNRIIQPEARGVGNLLVASAKSSQPGLPELGHGGLSAHVLTSHAISPAAMAALHRGDRSDFLRIRRDAIDAATQRLIERHAEWEHSDRLSLAALSKEQDD
jgi:hypothetical protein